MSAASSPRGSMAGESEEEDGSEHEPTEEEVAAYAEYLGIEPETEPHLLWIAAEGVVAPVPKPWKACQEGDEVFYFNFETKESMWDHPSDSKYRELVEKYRALGPEGAPAPGERRVEDSKSSVSEAESKEAAAGRPEGSSAEMEPAGGPEDRSRSSRSSSPRSDDGPAAARREASSGSRSAGSEAGPPRSPSRSRSGSPASERSAGSSRRSSSPPRSPSPKALAEPARTKEEPAAAANAAGIDAVKGPLAASAAGPGPAARAGAGASESRPGSARSSNRSDFSEDRRSDWGLGSPAVSAREGPDVPPIQSLDPPSSRKVQVKTWTQLRAELKALAELFKGVRSIRNSQEEYLQRLKTGTSQNS